MTETRNPRPNLLADEDLPAEPHQKRSLEKRARLKSAGLALFGEKGYENTSIQEIATRADLAVGGFYLHYRSKRQLLLALMDELLDRFTRLDLRPTEFADIRAGLRGFLLRAFATDLQYLGAWRAFQEAAFSDADLARKQIEIQAWTTMRVTAFFTMLQQLRGARPRVDIPGLARAMDSFFWNFLAQAVHMPEPELDRWIDAATHLIYHALFVDSAGDPPSS
ncbi:MAG TPA: helix-turn-helix domain-containing protein [Bryobacteraceae bacterium]|nr:helix-turn-helix domain-containing protein [Bryobacteraceae bacterium]